MSDGRGARSGPRRETRGQAAFILEGIRDGLDNADLDKGSDFVQRDIERLNDVVFRYDSAAGQAAG